MRKNIKYLCLIFIISCSGGSSQNNESQNGNLEDVVFPTHPLVWDVASPESVGMDSQLLGQAFDYAFEDGSFTQAAIVIKNGKLVFEKYRGITDNEAESIASALGTDPNLYKNIFGYRERNNIVTSWSTAKSFTSFLIGIAIENGYINSLNESASTFISEWSSDDRNTITIKDLLDMRSGLYPVCYDSSENILAECSNAIDSSSGGNLVFSDDQLTGCIERSFAQDGAYHPWFKNGTNIYTKGDFVYSNCDTMVLGEIIFRSTGQDIQTYAEYNLFSKININAEWWRDYTLEGQSNGNYLAYCCLDSTARDFAKFGYMLLLEGVWDNGTQSYSNYIEAIKNLNSYGLQFWTLCVRPANGCDESIISTIGFDGQYIMIDFPNNLIVIRNSLYYPIQNQSNEKKMKLINSDISQSNWVATAPRGLGSGLNTSFDPSEFYRLVTNSIN